MWNPGARIEVADADAAMAAVNLVAVGSAYPLLVDMAAPEYVSRQARAVFAAPCAAFRIALLGAIPVDRVLVNFQLSRQEPIVVLMGATFYCLDCADLSRVAAGWRSPVELCGQPRSAFTHGGCWMPATAHRVSVK
jgi:hypothetical protein